MSNGSKRFKGILLTDDPMSNKARPILISKNRYVKRSVMTWVLVHDVFVGESDNWAKMRIVLHKHFIDS